MRFGGSLALIAFAFVLGAGTVRGVAPTPLLEQGLLALLLFWAFGTGVGRLGEWIVTEDLKREGSNVKAEIEQIQREHEELAGVHRHEERGVTVMTTELVPGQILADDARTPSGEVLFRKGTKIAEADVARIIVEGVRRVRVLA